MERAVLPIGIASLVILAFNFILDFSRRSDLDAARSDLASARSEYEAWFHGAEADLKKCRAAFERKIASGLSLTREFHDLCRSEAASLEVARKLVGGLAAELERLKSAVAEAAAPPLVEEPPKVVDVEVVKRHTLADRFLNTSLEKLIAFDESRRKALNTYEGRLESKLKSATHWDVWQLVHDLKEHYGVELNHNDEALLYLKFDWYESIFKTAQAYHQASLDNDEKSDVQRSSMIPDHVIHSLVDEAKTFIEKRRAK